MKKQFFEVTTEEENLYLEQIAKLEIEVLNDLEKKGKIGLLFITGKDDISNYIHSKENSVWVATNENRNLEAAVYITRGQKPFTYNDITKYFKVGKEYREYVKNLYTSETEYKKDMLEAYSLKMLAYNYARTKIQKEFPEYHSIAEFLEHEIQSDNNFDEKSILREKVNEYMAEYILQEIERTGTNKPLQQYERFYWMTAQDIGQEYHRDIHPKLKNKKVEEYEKYLQLETEYTEILQKGHLQIHEKPIFKTKKYFTANTSNAIEIDTYITKPGQRNAGLARILVYEGIKKKMQECFQDVTQREIFLCSTLHRDNLSSKYVSEFFGLKDSLYVKRRQGRDREVHITRIGREEEKEYLQHLQRKMAVLYGYNPENIKIPDKIKKEIIQEQLEYEKNEYRRLNKKRHEKGKRYHGNVESLQSKARKIILLKEKLKAIEQEKER